MKLQRLENDKAKERVVVILSAERKESTTQENHRRTIKLESMLSVSEIHFSRAIGVYENEKEVSFVCVLDNPSTVNSLLDISKSFDQECILVRFPNRVELHYGDGNKEIIGKELKQVPQEVATKEDGYTILNGKYYVVK